MVRYFAIKRPDGLLVSLRFNGHDSWRKFFDDHTYKLPMAESIKAFESIGYKCVQVDVKEIK